MRIGSLFSGYGGLCELTVAPLLGGDVVWHSEWEAPTKHNKNPEQGAAKILAHHWPDKPNHGDLTQADWAKVEPVDVLTGGFPCQDLSHAGKRLGLRPGSRSGLWSHMAYAISCLRPRMVVIENVRGILSASAHGDLEPCAWCVGDDESGPLRALGAVLGDLAGLGYDARWAGVRASDAGAPHGRFRVFIVATDTSGGPLAGPGANRDGLRVPAERGDRAAADTENDRQPHLVTSGRQQALTKPAGDRCATALSIETLRLLPTPTSMDAHASGGGYNGQTNVTLTDATSRQPECWGEYADAIHRWEHLTREAPEPTQTSARGKPRLAPVFSEWMMGLPAGHVTNVPISRNAQLKALGNGVVPQQAALALRLLMDALRAAA